MGLTRRGLFAAAPAAAMVAPDVAREMISLQGAPIDRNYGLKIAEQKKWEAEQLAKLKRVASGDLRSEDFWNEPCPAYGMELEARAELKSMSPRARSFVNRVHAERRQRESMIERAKQALLEYDKSGLIKMLF